MPKSPRWEKRILYAFLVGRLDRDRTPVSSEAIADSLLDLYASLRNSLSGLSYLKPFEAVGDTAVWGAEPTTVVLVLTEPSDGRAADAVIAEHTGRLRFDLRQDEVWVTKQDLQLYVASKTR